MDLVAHYQATETEQVRKLVTGIAATGLMGEAEAQLPDDADSGGVRDRPIPGDHLETKSKGGGHDGTVEGVGQHRRDRLKMGPHRRAEGLHIDGDVGGRPIRRARVRNSPP